MNRTHYESTYMNYITILVIFCLSLASSLCSQEQPLHTIHIKGIIESANSLDFVPEYVIRYKGKETRNTTRGFFNFTLEADKLPTREPSLLICKKDHIVFEKKNTPEAIVPQPEKKYRYFTQQNDESWKEESLENKELPEEYITILISPSLVASIEPWDIDLAKTIKSPFIQLPKIVLHPINDAKKSKSEFMSLNISRDTAWAHEHAMPDQQEVKLSNGSKVLVTQ